MFFFVCTTNRWYWVFFRNSCSVSYLIALIAYDIRMIHDSWLVLHFFLVLFDILIYIFTTAWVLYCPFFTLHYLHNREFTRVYRYLFPFFHLLSIQTSANAYPIFVLVSFFFLLSKCNWSCFSFSTDIFLFLTFVELKCVFSMKQCWQKNQSIFLPQGNIGSPMKRWY